MRAELMGLITTELEKQFGGIRVFDRAVNESEFSGADTLMMVIFTSAESDLNPGQREHETMNFAVRLVDRRQDGKQFQKLIAHVEDRLYGLFDAVRALTRNDTANWHDWYKRGLQYAEVPGESYEKADLQWAARYDYARGSASGE